MVLRTHFRDICVIVVTEKNDHENNKNCIREHDNIDKIQYMFNNF